MTRCRPRKPFASPSPSSAPATSGPSAEKVVWIAVKVPSVVPTRPSGARLAVSGLSTGAYIVSPTAKMPKVVTKSAEATSGVSCATESTTHDSVQMAPTTMSRVAASRLRGEAHDDDLQGDDDDAVDGSGEPDGRLVDVEHGQGVGRQAGLELRVEAERQRHRDDRGPAQSGHGEDAAQGLHRAEPRLGLAGGEVGGDLGRRADAGDVDEHRRDREADAGRDERERHAVGAREVDELARDERADGHADGLGR